MLQITDEIGRRIQYRYEGDLLTDVIHTDKGITHYEYDDKNRRNTIKFSESGKREVYEYNDQRLTERVIYEDGTSMSYGYSEQNMRTLQVSRTGIRTSWQYDDYDRKICEISPDGLETHFE